MESETQPNSLPKSPEDGAPKGSQKKPLRRGLWEWLGFGEKGEKTGLDLLQLLVTASIPVVVALGGLWFTANQNQNQRALEEQRSQEEALQTYLEQMGSLLLENDLLDAPADAEASVLARARTLTVLNRLDAERKGSVVRFLYESGLIVRGEREYQSQDFRSRLSLGPFGEGAVSLSKADLTGADLYAAYLAESDFSGADLSNADLRFANLSDANLEGTDLEGADLTMAILIDAEGRRGPYTLEERLEKEARIGKAKMPDGSVHD